MKLPGWFHSRERGTWDGRNWISNGGIVLAVDSVDESVRDMSKGFSQFFAMHEHAPTIDANETDRLHGYAILNGRVFCAHFLDLVSAAHPGATWKVIERDDMGPAIAYVDGRIVGAVMGNRTARGAMAERPGYPKCNGCGGSGKRDCPECDGTGEVEHECSCGSTCEHDCNNCDGSGNFGKCPACDGTGRWRETPAEASP